MAERPSAVLTAASEADGVHAPGRASEHEGSAYNDLQDAAARNLFAIPNRIREVREARGLKQRELAELVAVDAPLMSQIERGRVLPSLDLYRRLLKALRASRRHIASLYPPAALALIHDDPGDLAHWLPAARAAYWTAQSLGKDPYELGVTQAGQALPRRERSAVRALKRPLTPAERMESRLRQAHTRFGLTPEEFDDMLDRQGGRCAICGATLGDEGELSHLDHDHATGRVRGFLCPSCNFGLGWFRDDAVRLSAAARYLAQQLRDPDLDGANR